MIKVSQLVDVIKFELGILVLNLNDRFIDLDLDHLDLRDILYYLEQELNLVMDDLWNEDDLIEKFPTVNDLIGAYEEAYDLRRED